MASFTEGEGGLLDVPFNKVTMGARTKREVSLRATKDATVWDLQTACDSDAVWLDNVDGSLGTILDKEPGEGLAVEKVDRVRRGRAACGDDGCPCLLECSDSGSSDPGSAAEDDRAFVSELHTSGMIRLGRPV